MFALQAACSCVTGDVLKYSGDCVAHTLLNRK